MRCSSPSAPRPCWNPNRLLRTQAGVFARQIHDLLDADLSGNPDNIRSTGAVQWGSRLQPYVSLSSTKSEFTIAPKVGCEVMWIRYVFEGIGYDMS